MIRSDNRDFLVSEVLSFVPAGDGEHRYFQIRKSGHNSQWVANALAAVTGTRGRDVGFAGHKDRHGVTTQWFSVCGPGDTPPEGLPDGVDIVAMTRHRRKLQKGALRGNRFDITVRDVEGDRFLLDSTLARLGSNGFPNYFGAQRFGHGGANLARARDWFGHGRAPRRRNQRSFALSAARSQLFNLLLGWRVKKGDWCELMPGDVAQLAGTRSVFRVDQVDDTLRARVASGDVDPTGPLWGDGLLATDGTVLALEMQLCDTEPELTRGLAAAGLRQERRALRVLPTGLTGAMQDQTLRLRFELPRGSFATSLLREIIDYVDVAADRVALTPQPASKERQ